MSHPIHRVAADLRQAFNSWYGWLGVLVAILAATNFVFSVYSLKLSVVIATLVATYVAIFHGVIDWICKVFGVSIPKIAKDILVLYSIFAGSTIRTMMQTDRFRHSRLKLASALMATMRSAREQWLAIPFRRSAIYVLSIWDPWWAWRERPYFWEASIHWKESWRPLQPFSIAHATAPWWLARFIESIIWPLFVLHLFRFPLVYHDSTKSIYFEAKRNWLTMSPLAYDRVVVFTIQVSCIVFGTTAVVIVNGFLTVPAS